MQLLEADSRLSVFGRNSVVQYYMELFWHHVRVCQVCCHNKHHQGEDHLMSYVVANCCTMFQIRCTVLSDDQFL